MATIPYPLVLAEDDKKKLVLFIESPFKKFETEEPWELLQLRGACVLEGRRMVKQVVFERELTLAITSFPPKPFQGNPEDVLSQLLGGKGPCPRVNVGDIEALKCGHILLVFGKESFPPLGFGTIKTRVDVIGARLRLKA